ncbi:MAG: zf-HC2 domain-containing protein [Clostridiales bacterium]|nr:zf-HC2 domain-containing protein [Clostridiales bacterium]MBE5812003.1 zf-HC2 domain-containing protein [Clostridiales bacterium]
MSDKQQLADKCAVTRDLMPLCIDGTASDASQRRVKKHVKDCPPCATVYQEMQTQIDLDVPDQQEAQQFDTAVKKVKHKHAWRKVRNVLLGIVMALVVCAGLAYGYYWYFVEEVPLPVDLYQMELTLNTSSSQANPVIIRTENMPKPAKLHIEVRKNGTVMDANQQIRPNREMYIWATTTRATDLDNCGYTNYNYYGFDKVYWEDGGAWLINGWEYQIDTIYKGAPEVEQTLLYRSETKESLKWMTAEYVLHAVASIEVKDDGKPDGGTREPVYDGLYPYVTVAPTFQPMQTQEPAEGLPNATTGTVALHTVTPMPASPAGAAPIVK